MSRAKAQTVHVPDVVKISKFRTVDWSSLDINVNLISYSARMLYEQYRKGIIFADPEMQREYEWNQYTASRWIESLIYGLPVPPIMLIREEDNRYMILDGLQRIHTIYLFFENKLRLVGVDPRLEGKTYSDLPSEVKNVLELESRVPAYVITIRSGKREDVIYAVLDLFRRINLGAKKLTANQVLFCTVRTTAMKIVREVADEHIAKLVEATEVEKKMFIHRICALIAFLDVYYSDNVIRLVTVSGRGKYLDDMLKFLAEEDVGKLSKLREDVLNVVELLRNGLGVGRQHFIAYTWGLASRRTNRINIPLFSIIFHGAWLLYKYVGSLDRAMKLAEELMNIYRTVLSPDYVINGMKMREWFLMIGKRRGSEVKLVNYLARDIDQKVRNLVKSGQ